MRLVNFLRALFARARPARIKVTMAALTESDLYYLRSIQRQLEMVKESLDDRSSFSLGGMAFADNVDWLDCFIDAHERARRPRHEQPNRWRNSEGTRSAIAPTPHWRNAND